MLITDIVQYCHETLLRGDSKGGVSPWLAESYEIAGDRSSITFKLKQGIKFHDGSDFNAEVAKWNLDNMIAGNKEPSWASVDQLDDYSIRVNFTKWDCTLPMSFAEGNTVAYMVSKDAYDKNGVTWMRTHAVGTGPFKFETLNPDQILRFVKNSDYWIKDKPYLDAIQTIIVSDLVTMKMLVQSREIDMITVSPGKQASDYAALGMKINTIMDSNYILVPDTVNADSPWANKAIREAVEYAIDREAIAKAFGFGFWQAPYQLAARDSLAYDPNFTGARKHDPAKAKELLAAAGYSNGFQTTIYVSEGARWKDVSVAMQSNLADAGIQAKIRIP